MIALQLKRLCWLPIDFIGNLIHGDKPVLVNLDSVNYAARRHAGGPEEIAKAKPKKEEPIAESN